jgi:hypothetical protein
MFDFRNGRDDQVFLDPSTGIVVAKSAANDQHH